MTDQPRALANSFIEPPYSQEAEAALLGAVLVNPDMFLTIASFLKADDFYILRHKYIWEAFMRLNTRDEAIDLLTVAEELQNMGWLNDIGEAYLTHLVNVTPTSLHAEFYGRIVERAAIRRRLMQAADEIKALAMNEEMDIDRVITDAEVRLFNVTERQLKREFVHLQDAVETYWNQIDHIMQNPHISLGVPSGFKDLDELLGGFQRSDLVIFAGRPGMGKCLDQSSLIDTGKNLTPITALKPSGVHGIADDEGGIYYPLHIPIQTPHGVRETAYFYESGVRPTLTITTRNGLVLGGTYTHPVLTRMADGSTCWTPLGLIKRGDRIAVQPNSPVWDNQWDTVSSVDDTGLQPCYDLTVPDGHAFVANGIVNHNTSFLLSTAVNAARLGSRIAIFTMEMGAEQLVQRMIAMETGINMQQLRLGKLNPHEYSRFVEAAGRISRFPIFIDDTPALNPIQMRTKCRRLQHEHGIDMVILDYMQLMNSGGSYENNRVQEVSFISRAIKELARELNAPIISAAQLSRSVEQRQDKRPLMSDLRESGSIEQDSDVILFLYRDSVYNEATEFPNQADVIVAKHRNGPTGTVSMYFDRTLTKFMDAAVRHVDLGGV